MRKKMYVEVIEPKSIALTKKQDKWVITYVERDEIGAVTAFDPQILDSSL